MPRGRPRLAEQDKLVTVSIMLPRTMIEHYRERGNAKLAAGIRAALREHMLATATTEQTNDC